MTNKTTTKTINKLDFNFEHYSKLSKSVALVFQDASKYDRYSFISERGSIMLFSSPMVVSKIVNPYKCYPTSKRISLMDYVSPPPQVNVFDVIQRRRTRRNYQEYSISLSELYLLLYYTYGITGRSKIEGQEGFWYFRTVPSGGGLYPLEIYVYMNNSSLPKGLYHYRPDLNALEEINNDDNLNEYVKLLAVDNVDIATSSCLVFITSVFQRTMLKYGERGYRFILHEVGHTTQNLSLVSESLNLASCILGGYLDDDINELLGINGVTETIQNVIVIGKQ